MPRGCTSPATLSACLDDARARLRLAGVRSPGLDAEVLLAEATGLDRAELIARGDEPLESAATDAVASMLERREAREPVAYIVGRRGFRRLQIGCDRRALIPRPESELLVELARGLDPARVIDLGTGSGAIALALADELPRAEVVGLDVSAGALELAAANAEHLELGDRLRFEQRTLDSNDQADLLVANLPYVREDEWDSLAPEITAYEPRLALVSGVDGLDAIRQAVATLDPRSYGTVAFEVGGGQAAEVARLLASAGFETRIEPDLAGIERVVTGTAAGG